jgi:hypothetical protein
MQRLFLSLPGLFLFLRVALGADSPGSIVVKAGEFDRRGTIVTFALPSNLRAVQFLRHDGKTTRLQVANDGAAAFVIDDLKKGTERSYEVLGVTAVPLGEQGAITARRDGTKLKFGLAEAGRSSTASPRPLLEYQAEPGAVPRDNIKPAFARGGYLHPIYTPAGKLVTDDFPPNHIHHHGVWWAWTHTEFQGRLPDFWNMGDGKGKVDFVSLDQHWSGPVHGGFQSKHRFMDLSAPQPVNALNESWEIKVYASPATAKFWQFDLVSVQRCATDAVLKLPTYRYGGVGLRGNWAWNGKDKTFFLTSDGETDRDRGNTSLGRWCDMAGDVEGGRVGIAILGHPDNFRAPQPMRLHPTEPFFNFAPQQAGDMDIKPGQDYVSRYRFVVHDGPPDRAELDRLWNDFAHPPGVKLVEK